MIDTDFESRIADSLHARADRPIETAGLRTAALARARVIRRRQVSGAVAGAGLAVAAVAVVAAGVTAASPGPAADGPAASPESDVVEVMGSTTLPGLPGVPSAAEQPAAVGTDPAALHFDVDLAALAATASDWHSGPGYEGVTVPITDDTPRVDLYIGPDAGALDAARPNPGPYVILDDGGVTRLYDEAAPEPTTVDGRPATLQEVTPRYDGSGVPEGARAAGFEAFQHGQDGPVWVLRWQPVAGLHVIAQSSDQDLVYAAAAALRVDRAQRCAVPLRLSAAPAGAEWTECRTMLRHDPAGEDLAWALSSLTLSRTGGDPIVVYAEDAEQAGHPADTELIVPNRTVAGYPAWWSEESPAGLYVPAFGPAGNQAAVFVAGTDEALAVWLVEHLRVAGELDRPDTWPGIPVG
jgi:hypothetical protein